MDAYIKQMQTSIKGHLLVRLTVATTTRKELDRIARNGGVVRIIAGRNLCKTRG